MKDRMKPILLSCVLSLITPFYLALTVSATDTTAPAPKTAPEGRDAPIWNEEAAMETPMPPVVKKIRDGVLLVGEVTVDKPAGLVSMKGSVNMSEGLVEYLACGPRGKLHESVLSLNAAPYDLQIALLLIGLEPGNKPLEFQGAPGVPEGDPVEIWVSWQGKDNATAKHRAEDLIYDKSAGKPMPHTHWVFTGSQILDGRFMAQVEQSFIATYHDPFAMLDHPLASGANDTVYFANDKLLPPKGTPVTMEIRSLKNAGQKR